MNRNTMLITVVAVVAILIAAATAIVVFGRNDTPVAETQAWNGFALEAKQVLVGNDTTKFPFDTQGEMPSLGDNFVFIHLTATNKQMTKNTNLSPDLFDLQLSNGQTKSVALAQFVSDNHWPASVDSGATVDIWLVYECPKYLSPEKLHCLQPSIDKPVVLIQVPQATLIIKGDDDEPPTTCPYPWPSKIEFVLVPSLTVGQASQFQVRAWVQNKNPDCTIAQVCSDPSTGQPMDWCYAPDTPISWTFDDGQGHTVTGTSTTDGVGMASFSFTPASSGSWTAKAHWDGKDKYVAADASATVTTNSSYWFTDLHLNGFYDMGRPFSSSDMILQPEQLSGALDESKMTSMPEASEGYYFVLDAVTQQAYIDYLKANGFNHTNVWGNAGAASGIPFAEWHVRISAAGIGPNDVVMNGGWGWSSMSMNLGPRPFSQAGVGSIGAHLEYVPSAYSMGVTGSWGGGMWTNADVVVGNFPAKTPAAIEFYHPGTYTLTFYLDNRITGEVMSPELSVAVTLI